MQDVFEADVEGGVGVGGEGVAGFAGNVAGAGVVVSYCVFDLDVISSLVDVVSIGLVEE